MANNCFYDMHVRGSIDNVDQFLDILQYKHHKYQFSRVFGADVYDFEVQSNEEGSFATAMVYGDCAWSVAVCMTDCDWSYQLSIPKYEMTTLQNMSRQLNLDIEVWSEEPGMGFQEHYLYKNGVEVLNVCLDDYISAFYDPEEYPNFKDFAQAIGHPEIKIDDLCDGWYEYKHDPIFEF